VPVRRAGTLGDLMGVSARRLRILMVGSSASLAIAGLASIGTVQDAEDRARQVVVSAAGQGLERVGLPPTTTAPPASVAPAMTAPPAPPLPPVTSAPATTSTTAVPRSPATTAASRTTTTASGGPALVTLVNDHGMDVAVTINGQPFQLGPGQVVGPVAVIPASSGNDIVELNLAADPTCGDGDAEGLFAGGRAYRFTVVAASGNCQGGYPGPDYRLSPA
ncbi:MAG: hypothetical protein LC708_01715, partial [Actinobacteria bacterium]|nr:hypothetical protein [Actinomycetota bacterium]